MTVLIIEDEIKAAKELEMLLQELLPDVQTLAILQSVEEVEEWYKENEEPDLIFSDISLADGMCFDIFETTKINAPIIFCTAYNEFALKAFENNGFDYLLKPIEKDKLQNTIDKIKKIKGISMEASDEYSARLNNLINQFPSHFKSSLLSYFRGIITPISTTDISYIYMQHNSILAIAGDQKYELNDSLDNLMECLSPQDFFRANRQFIIRRTAILKIESLFTRKLAVSLKSAGSPSVIVSKAKASEFLRWVEGA